MALLEREAPLQALRDALSRVARHGGSVVGVAGEAGIGKTSLLEAFAESARPDARFLWGGCEALATPRPLGPLLDIAAGLGGEVQDKVTGGAPRHQVLSALLAALGRGGVPSVVMFEDVHWADEATLDLLQFLGRRIGRTRALLVVTWRSDEVGLDHPFHRVLGTWPAAAQVRIDLDPLSIPAVASLAGSPELASELHALTGGNPFLVTELVRVGGDQIPAGVTESVLARRLRLPPEARDVVDLVSVVPGRVGLDVVRHAICPSSEAIEACLSVGLLRMASGALAFRHELARMALLDALPRARAVDLHGRVLTALQTAPDRSHVLARLVHHAVAAERWVAVQEHAPAAARQAAAQGSHREAASHYRAVLARPDLLDPQIEVDLLEAYAFECYVTGDIRAATSARTAALERWRRLGNVEAAGRTIRWLSRLAWFRGDNAEAVARADEAIATLGGLPSAEELAMAYSNRSQLYMLEGDAVGAVDFGRRAIALAQPLGSDEVLIHALNNVGTALAMTGDRAGRSDQEESLARALDHDLHEHVARAYTNLATCAIMARDYAYAARWLEEGLDYTTERDLDAWTWYMQAWRARMYAETGRWDDAALDAEAVLAGGDVAVVSRIPALTALGLVRLRRGDPGVEDVLGEARALARGTGESQRIAPVHAALAERAWLSGDLEAARAEADRGLAATPSSDLERSGLAFWSWRAGGAPPTLDPASPSPYGLQAAGRWREAADQWAALGCPYERALALMDGDDDAAREALEELVALEARPLAEQVRTVLRERGIVGLPRGPRAATRHHPAGLTPREADVLALVAEGLTNREIGRRLFVSPKTVEHHVSSVLAKLGVAGRREAVAMARGHGWLN